MEYKIIATDGRAKRAEMTTVHGKIQTPVFMNVGTVAAIKGAVSTDDLREIRTQVELSNTYHLHVRTGDKLIKEFGGLHKFMNWDRPILTDSGGFQVFSLAKMRKIKEEGVYFNSHIDGRKIFMGPEESMQIQSNLGSTIAMAFDECPSSVADRKYVENSVARTTRWLERCRNEMARLNALPDTVNKEQLLFGINQGAVFEDATFSGGEQQRVNIARGFIRPSPILLLDEPTASLDGANRQVVIDLIREARGNGAAIVGIFHDDVAREAVADRTIPVRRP